jgi:hypothetical protein
MSDTKDTNIKGLQTIMLVDCCPESQNQLCKTMMHDTERVWKHSSLISFEYPAACRLSDNSILEQKHAKNKVSEAFKSKKKEFNYYW